MRIGYWRLEDKFTQDYVENIGVKEVVVSYLLRHNIDIMVFQVIIHSCFIFTSRIYRVND